ncbi:thermonuclease family protein [Sulfitobacter mediterraneus]|uniref:thermonuclease family protein n=1 Tax=Sulfitobacter mediterraneus TaxID=83219 RepID=UPI00248FBF8B|nr:thermonuclease family protein [Sulfitobacter mediterraneus]
MATRLTRALLFAASSGIIAFGPFGAQAQEIVWRSCLPNEKRITCVVDGDTLWYQGTKIRLIGIDAPEVSGKCRRERRLAAQATDHLTALLNIGLRRIAFDGEDRYGRALARLWVTDGEVGPAMIAAGLAEHYGSGGAAPWCRG